MRTELSRSVLSRGSSRPRARRWLDAAVLVLGVAAVAACGAEDPGPPPLSTFGGVAPVSDDYVGEPCEEGDVRTCKVVLPAHNGVQNCVVGEQFCADGVWTACWDVDEGQEVDTTEP